MMKHSETAIFVAESTGHMPLIDGPAAPVNTAPLRRLLASANDPRTRCWR